MPGTLVPRGGSPIALPMGPCGRCNDACCVGFVAAGFCCGTPTGTEGRGTGARAISVRPLSSRSAVFAGDLTSFSGLGTADGALEAVATGDLVFVADGFFACSFVQNANNPTPPNTATASSSPIGDQRCDDREEDRFGEREVERVRRFF
ncbi:MULTISPECIES: hypothetical protein [unclassified Phyllobacterium]|uniref:hypothetical protein n=1 Tax=unclassified Phyllobacterium TaxID=2638441 RepID=UPI003012E49E